MLVCQVVKKLLDTLSTNRATAVSPIFVPSNVRFFQSLVPVSFSGQCHAGHEDYVNNGDHETRWKIIRLWMSLPQAKRQRAEHAAAPLVGRRASRRT
jgi:hypothetical protein